MTITQNSENLKYVAMETQKSWIADFKAVSGPEAMELFRQISQI